MLLCLPVVRPSFQSFLQTGCQRVLEIFLVDTSGKSWEKNALKTFSMAKKQKATGNCIKLCKKYKYNNILKRGQEVLGILRSSPSDNTYPSKAWALCDVGFWSAHAKPE